MTLDRLSEIEGIAAEFHQDVQLELAAEVRACWADKRLLLEHYDRCVKERDLFASEVERMQGTIDSMRKELAP